ncbi:MAG: hypothetical protein R3346_00080 [Candidatus Spechtbacterales bacterium]|nr:hypothetical protein [Candidatus Spechtbacterales bacterium]
MKISRKSIREAYKTTKTIFKQRNYALLALGIAIIVLMISVWLPNISLISDVVTSSTTDLQHKITILWSTLGGIRTNFTTPGAIFLIFISLLVGLNLALTIYYFKRRLRIQKANGVSLIGMIIGLVGIGCASCGSIVLASIIGLGATASLIGALPFHGQEFNIMSIIVLLLSFYVVAKKAYDPLVCES